MPKPPPLKCSAGQSPQQQLAEKELAAEFAAEEARHSRGLYDLLIDLGEDPEEIIAGRPDAEEFWGLNLDNWLDIVRSTSPLTAREAIRLEYRDQLRSVGASQEEVLEDEEDHYDNGVENLKQFAKDPKQLAAFQEIYDRVMPNCLKRAFGRLEGATRFLPDPRPEAEQDRRYREPLSGGDAEPHGRYRTDVPADVGIRGH